MTMKRAGAWDPDFGRVPTGRVLPARSGRGGDDDVELPGPLSRGRGRQPGLPAAVPRQPGRQGALARRHRGLRQRDRAVPQPVAVPARVRRERRRVQGPHPARVPPAARRGQGQRRARPAGRLRLLPGQRRRRRPRRLGVRGARPPSRPATGSPASTRRRSCASATSSARGTAAPASSTTPRSTSSRWARTVSEATAELFAENRYQEYLLLHGLGVEMAEALAEYWHHRIRTEWGFVDEDGPTVGGLFRQQYRGGRYSWGYPACPDLEDNATVARAARRRAPRHRGQRGDGLAVPARADDLGHHLPPPPAKYFVAR